MINNIQSAYDYAADVKSGKIIVNRYIKLAVDRYYKDIEDIGSNGFLFDERAAQKALSFFELLCFTKGKWKGNPFKLEPWQAFIVANIFGWKRESDKTRRFTEAYVEIPKKNGKTELAAGVGLYMLLMDREPGAEVYAAAYTRDQAGICFNAAKSMARKSKSIAKHLTIFTYNLYQDSTESSMAAVSHDANNTEGKNSHCVLFDEYHVHKTDDVKTSLRSGMAARSQPLFFTITTAGSNKQGPCYKYRDGCITVLENKVERSNMFCMIYGLDEGDDWQDEAMWSKANPNYDVSVRPQFLKDEFKKAKTNGREEVEFKTKHLNQWVDADITWINSELWTGLAKPSFNPPAYSLCYGGLDLATISDICSFSLFFPEQEGIEQGHFVSFHFVPKGAVEKARTGGIDYLDWVKDGHLIVTPGETTNHDLIKEEILRCCEYYAIRFIAYDRYEASQLVRQLDDELSPTYIPGNGKEKAKYEPRMQQFSQKAVAMNAPTKAFEKFIVDKNITHDGSPVTSWMLGNVSIFTDSSGNIKVDKGKSKDKVDGVVAMIMALGEYLAWNWEGKYSTDVAVW